jgi:glucokinase
MRDEMTPDMLSLPLVVGVDVGGTQIRAAVLRGATLLSRAELLTGEDPTPDHVIPRICNAIRQVIKEADTSLENILGIGIGIAGELDSRTGVVFSSPNLSEWNQIPLRQILEQQFNIPIHVENDANAAALAEYKLGAGHGYKNVVYLTISTGIGGAVIIDGKLIEGASGTGGELGHMTIDWRGDRCNCGNIGCLEYLASGTAIARFAKEAISSGCGTELLTFARILEERNSVESKSLKLPVQSTSIREDTDGLGGSLHIDARIVALAAEAGVPLACSIIARAAEALGVGLVNIIHIFNPERIVLGGGVAQMGSILIDPAKQIVQNRTIKIFRDVVQIVQAQLGRDAGLVGAATLIYQKEGMNMARSRSIQ